jgi:hypothetical protein
VEPDSDDRSLVGEREGRTPLCSVYREKSAVGLRNMSVPSDDRDVTAAPDRSDASLLELYDRALPQVYGYLLGRCGDRAVAQDLTPETLLAVAKGTRGHRQPSAG